MGVNSRQDSLSELMKHIILLEGAVKKFIDYDRQVIMAIYDLISKRMVTKEKLTASEMDEMDAICKKIIKRYNQFIALRDGSFNEEELLQTLHSFYTELNLICQSVKETIENIEGTIEALSLDTTVMTTLQGKFNPTPTGETQSTWGIDLKNNYSLSAIGKVFELQLIMNHRTAVYGNILHKRRNGLVKAVDRFTSRFHLLLKEYFSSRLLRLSVLLKKLQEIPVGMPIHDPEEIQRSLNVIINGLLIFLQHFDIEVMPVFPGDKFHLNRHKCIREVKISGINPEMQNTILEVHRTGFMKDGIPYFPAQVVVQI